MHKFKHGELHSGSDKGPKVTNRKQALAIMLSEKRKADSGDSEYKAIGPDKKTQSEMIGKKKGILRRKKNG